MRKITFFGFQDSMEKILFTSKVAMKLQTLNHVSNCGVLCMVAVDILPVILRRFAVILMISNQ